MYELVLHLIDLYTSGIILCTLFCNLLFPYHTMFLRSSMSLQVDVIHSFTSVFIHLLHCWLTIGFLSVFLVLQCGYEHVRKRFSWLHAQEYNCWAIRYAHLQPYQIMSNCFSKVVAPAYIPPGSVEAFQWLYIPTDTRYFMFISLCTIMLSKGKSETCDKDCQIAPRKGLTTLHSHYHYVKSCFLTPCQYWKL